MALSGRFSGTGAGDVARFLRDHQQCDQGFDVHRDGGLGAGRLMITCHGCRESITYRAADAGHFGIEQYGLRETEATRPAGDTLPREPEPALAGQAGGGLGEAPLDVPVADGERGSRSWLPVVAVGGLIAAGLVALVVGLTRGDGEAAGSGDAAATTTVTVAAPEPVGPAAGGPAQPPREIVLVRREFDDVFSIGVPAGWAEGTSGDATTLDAPGDVAFIRIYYEFGERTRDELARGAAGFLADQHPGGKVIRLPSIRVGGARAARVAVKLKGGTETALVLTDEGYSFLVWSGLDNRAKPRTRSEAKASVRSFSATG